MECFEELGGASVPASGSFLCVVERLTGSLALSSAVTLEGLEFLALVMAMGSWIIALNSAEAM